MNKQRQNVMGALYSTYHKTKRHEDAIHVSKASGYPLLMLNKDIVNPSEEKLNQWYNGIKVWFSPSELEGLHNCPMEASLASCGLVCSDTERGGTRDYAIHEKTCLVYPHGKLSVASKYIKMLMIDDGLRIKLNEEMVKLLKSKIGTRKENMLKFMEYIRG
jgi:hypothetical protein